VNTTLENPSRGSQRRDSGSPHRPGLLSSLKGVASHTFIVLSPLPDTMRLPSAENATLLIPTVCPLRVSVSCPECASHTFTVWSQLPEAMRLPSGENATLLTKPVWPLRV